MKEEQTLNGLMKELSEANELLKTAMREESVARSNATAAKNRVSSIQKAIDKEVEALHSSAEWDTEWHSKRLKRTAVNL